jgi:hypothetical protein
MTIPGFKPILNKKKRRPFSLRFEFKLYFKSYSPFLGAVTSFNASPKMSPRLVFEEAVALRA